MQIIVIPDSFKGTFTSIEVIKHIREGFMKHFDAIEFIEIPIADGGEGTVDALVHALKGDRFSCEVHDPLKRRTNANYGICGKTAIIEMAEASGITKISMSERNPLLTSTYGVGELILKALEHDVEELIVGIGGSATNDGGTGMLMALGVKFFDELGEILDEGGQILNRITRMDCTSLNPLVLKTPITVMCDVTNPLTGPQGATFIYGPQKGADNKMLTLLETGMCQFKKVLLNYNGIDVDDISGAGAAGGLGAALVSVLGATLKPGIEAILDIVEFDRIVEEADLVITGEGKLDEQTIYGKVPTGVSKRCIGKKAKVIALVGTEGTNSKKVYDYGIDAIISTINQPLSPLEIETNASKRLDDTIDSLCRILKIGETMRFK